MNHRTNFHSKCTCNSKCDTNLKLTNIDWAETLWMWTFQNLSFKSESIVMIFSAWKKTIGTHMCIRIIEIRTIKEAFYHNIKRWIIALQASSMFRYKSPGNKLHDCLVHSRNKILWLIIFHTICSMKINSLQHLNRPNTFIFHL